MIWGRWPTFEETQRRYEDHEYEKRKLQSEIARLQEALKLATLPKEKP